jgi:hypothetical protein
VQTTRTPQLELIICDSSVYESQHTSHASPASDSTLPTSRAEKEPGTETFKNLRITILTTNLQQPLFQNMTTHVEDDSETATEAWKGVPPLGSDDNTCDNKSSPCSSPPPVNKSVSFKPFATSRAQKRAIAEKASRETSTAATRTTSGSEDRQTASTGGQAEDKLAEEARSNNSLDSMDLKSLIDAAKQKALAKNKPKKAERVAELYERSLDDERLTVLLETALRTNATLEATTRASALH